VVLLVGLMCVGLPNGYVIGLVVGTAVAYILNHQLTGLGRT
jgi:hypothetical protein